MHTFENFADPTLLSRQRIVFLRKWILQNNQKILPFALILATVMINELQLLPVHSQQCWLVRRHNGSAFEFSLGHRRLIVFAYGSWWIDCSLWLRS